MLTFACRYRIRVVLRRLNTVRSLGCQPVLVPYVMKGPTYTLATKNRRPYPRLDLSICIERYSPSRPLSRPVCVHEHRHQRRSKVKSEGCEEYILVKVIHHIIINSSSIYPCCFAQGPNLSPGLRVRYGQACQSHPCLYISVPHHLKFFTRPGYMKPKKTTTSENANPESRAADRVMVYLPHQAEALRRTR